MCIFLYQGVLRSITSPQWRKIVQQVYFIGAKSFFVIVLIGLFTGMVLGLQGYYTLVKFGSDGALGAVVALAIIRELGPVLTAIMIRFALATAVLVPLVILLEGGWPRVSRRGCAILGLQALCGSFLFTVFLLAGLRLTGAAEAGVVAATTPAAVALLGRVLFRERLRGRALAGLTATCAGLLVLEAGSPAVGSHPLLGHEPWPTEEPPNRPERPPASRSTAGPSRTSGRIPSPATDPRPHRRAGNSNAASGRRRGKWPHETDLGLTNVPLDRDGVVRRFAPALFSSGEPRLSFAAALAARVAPKAPFAAGLDKPSALVPRSIPFAGPPGTFRHISLARLLADDALNDPEVKALAGKVVILGIDIHGAHGLVPAASGRSRIFSAHPGKPARRPGYPG